MFKDFIFETCVCGRKNLIKYSKCIACGTNLVKELRKQKAKAVVPRLNHDMLQGTYLGALGHITPHHDMLH